MISLSGCVYMIVGGVGALGGFIVSPDTVEGIITDSGQEDALEAAAEILSIMGVILERSDQGGIIIAKAQGTKITVTIVPISQSSVKVTVKARKAFFPKIKMAQDVYVKIVNYLKE